MKSTGQSLVFTHTPVSIGLGIGLVAVMMLVAWIAWKRSGFRPSIGFLEALRVFIAILIAIALNQPEWRETFEPETKPTLVVMADSSGSMETRDVSLGNESMSRADLAKPLVQPEAWAAIADKMDVVIEPFSSSEQPPEEGTDLNAALMQAAEKHPRMQALVLLSDGDWNLGRSPTQAATRLRMREVPVFAVPLGSETRLPDVALTSFDVPTFAVAGKPLRIPFSIESALPRDENVTIELSSTSGETVSKSVVIPAMGQLQDVLNWKPEMPGEMSLTLSLPKVGNEIYLENNTLTAPLMIRKEQLRVLVIETFPRWEYRYLRNALERDPGVHVDCLLFHPSLKKMGVGRDYLTEMPKDDGLATYDVVFLGDVGVEPGQLTLEQCESLRKMVRDQAAGLVFLPGMHGYEVSLLGTALGELMPVIWDEAQPRGWGTSSPGKFSLTEAGAHSLLTKLEETDEASSRVWETLPGFQWFAPALRAKAGAEILATHGTETNQYGRIALLVTKTYGAGKILFMGTDGAWRWRRGVEDKYHYRFWGQVVRWMAYQRNMSAGEKMRLFYSPDRPIAGSVLTLNVNVTSLTGEPLRDGAVIAQITAPSGKLTSVRLPPAGEDAWGLFTGVFTPIEPGEYKVNITCAEAGSALETTISAQGTGVEKRGRPARFDVLREIAQLTRGKMLENANPEKVLAEIAALPRPEPQERRIQIWANPWAAGCLILLLAVFWIGRKAAGVF